MRTSTVLLLLFAAILAVFSAGKDCSNQWKLVSAGYQHSLGLMKNGSLLAWGNNRNGQVGASDHQKEYNTPVPVKADAKWIQVATNYLASFGILSDGTLWGWGENDKGQLGDGTKRNRNEPVQIGTDNDWAIVASGYSHTLALKKDGSLWIWGQGLSGQLGMGKSVEILLEPTKILGEHKWVKIFAGYDQSFALRADGTLWAWGENSEGQLGDNTNKDKSSPVQIAPRIKWKDISVGRKHTLGLDISGQLYAWGDNYQGRLGAYTNVAIRAPIGVGYDTWKMISAGYQYSFGIMTDGTLWGWGANTYGQLGDDSRDESVYPVQIGEDYTWKHVSAGSVHTIAITTEGYMASWGANDMGNLGNEDPAKRDVLYPALCNQAYLARPPKSCSGWWCLLDIIVDVVQVIAQ